jgi:hypothetical protein
MCRHRRWLRAKTNPHHAYAEYARNACSSQEALTIKVGNTPSVQAGSEGVWLTVKLWVTDSNAASMQTGVSADQASQPEADVSAPELVAVAV